MNAAKNAFVNCRKEKEEDPNDPEVAQLGQLEAKWRASQEAFRSGNRWFQLHRYHSTPTGKRSQSDLIKWQSEWKKDFPLERSIEELSAPHEEPISSGSYYSKTTKGD
jgi:predicted  nucleic acid-binding Zn ribbon protein